MGRLVGGDVGDLHVRDEETVGGPPGAATERERDDERADEHSAT